MVEAGGVEPPSEKRYGLKTTCVAHSVFLPAALRMSKKRSQLVRWSRANLTDRKARASLLN